MNKNSVNQVEEIFHKPVLVKESLEILNPKSGGIFADFTTGFAGHSVKIMERIVPDGFLFGFELENFTFQKAEEILSRKFPHKNFKIINDSYSNVDKYIENNSLDGGIFDLGISSYEIDFLDFSFNSNLPLDLRFDRKNGEPFFKKVEKVSLEELSKIINKFGEVSFRDSKNFANIIKNCIEKGLINGKDILDEIKKNYQFLSEKRLKSLLSQVSQSLRIWINNELETLKIGLEKSFDALKSGGKIVVISFHSLEDRIVKNFIKSQKERWLLREFSEKPIVPSLSEISENKRSRSAKLRFFQKF